ncbi:MAG: (2Fe-2S)-binding protein [Elusimicrobia bacterium GWC2_51_8]|nr:MAG: (2Fe-2S)-binding protein [Elusimicrobia bacterium GWA2_51_34]OGR58428.1 MAG: (2Fe-2S)-binding protein [Elusimicrobia bacterium GWC2_51_8]HAF96113.1 (2Fe-2S)-binding protein [Elusimicrobiota bacterium]HCE97461.1 (2Fe-2S)-binding protein [Elusimicrobiota bacterium]
MKRHNIQFSLNNEKISIEVEPNDVLLDVLRNKLGIKSPKVGCDRGDCGTCTVLMNGRTVRSCLALAVEADGAEIVTLEGANTRKWTQKLQKKFHEKNAFQCGFCAPGVILSATELLEKNSKPDNHEIKEAIAGNLCRCTGYEPIVEAIAEAAKGK